jgi:DDE superfamily endonuclease
MAERQTRRLGTGEARFAAYLEAIAAVLGDVRRAASAEAYCTGLLLPGERKSVEPMAARIAPGRVQAEHQSMHHVVAKAEWDDAALLRTVREQVLPAIEQHGPVRYWMVDDTAFPKQGAHSVGVARQSCGQLGKQDNCQVAVSLAVANDHASLPIAYRLYLPEAWAEDPQRRAKAGVPGEIGFETKTAIALGQLRQAREQGIPVGTVLGDAAYGDECDFRVGVAELDLRYVLGIRSGTSVWPPGQAPLPPARSLVGPGTAANAPPPQPGAPAGLGQAVGSQPAPTGLAQRDLARGPPSRAHLPLRGPAGAPGAPRHPARGTLARGMAADRVARGRRRAEPVLAVQPATPHRAQGPGPHRQGPLADRAGLPGTGTQAGDRPRPL